MRHTLSILAVLASTALAGDIQARDACVDACNKAWDTCRTKPDANHASCAADFAGCVGYNPFESGSLVPPTTCVVTTSSTPAPSAPPASPCVTACNNAYDTCRSKSDANRASCASDYAGCLGYNPFESGSLITPTACAGPSILPTMVSPNATSSKNMYPPPGATTKPVQVAGAGNMKPAMALLAGVGAVVFL